MEKLNGKEATIEALKELLTKTEQLFPRIKLLHQLSRAYREIDMQTAHTYAQEAFQLTQAETWEKNPDQRILADSLSHLSFTHSKLNDLNSALQRGLQALAIYETLDFSSEYAAALTTVGFAYAIFGNHGEALQHALKGLEVSRAVDDLYEELQARNALGVVHGMAEDYEEAYCYFLVNESAIDEYNRPVLQQLNCPFIVMTALGNNQTAAEAAAPCVVKPVKPSRLYNALINLFDRTPLVTQTTAKSTGQVGPTTASLRLLIAEDNPINQKVAERILERLGYQADIVCNGAEVLAQLQQQPYDVILMDVQMPEMDGITATQKIQERYLPEERPYIIALTANALTGDKEQYLACGMNDYLSKPIRLEDMQNALNRFIERASSTVF